MRRIIVIIFSLIIIQGCNSKPSNSDIQKSLQSIYKSLVFVKGGSFMMGDAGGQYIDKNGKMVVKEFWTNYTDNRPAHKVILDSYSIMNHEVTYEEYDLFTKATNRKKIGTNHTDPEITRAKNIPVIHINWYEAKAYCMWLAKASNKEFDLPTEAQWEYAARSRGKNISYATDNGRLNYGRNIRERNSISPIQPAGVFPANPLGIYHMSGNVSEWVNDFYHSDYYQDKYEIKIPGSTDDIFGETYYDQRPEYNPPGPKSGYTKVTRGGSRFLFNKITVYHRYSRKPEIGDDEGIRCVVNQTVKIK